MLLINMLYHISVSVGFPVLPKENNWHTRRKIESLWYVHITSFPLELTPDPPRDYKRVKQSEILQGWRNHTGQSPQTYIFLFNSSQFQITLLSIIPYLTIPVHTCLTSTKVLNCPLSRKGHIKYAPSWIKDKFCSHIPGRPGGSTWLSLGVDHRTKPVTHAIYVLQGFH